MSAGETMPSSGGHNRPDDGPHDGPSISAKFVVVGPTAVGTGAIPRTGSGSGSNLGFLAPNQRTRALPFTAAPGCVLGASTTQINGRLVLRQNPSGVTEVLKQTGNQIDVCAALS
jgi:hypothetical protein